RRVGDLPVIEDAAIAAIVRGLESEENGNSTGSAFLRRRSKGGKVLIAHRDVVIEEGDHIIIFCIGNKVVKKVEKLFQVGLHFF
ncbi:MAG: Trk system potassium transporter TrkA, partial [Propionivibrio sp.]